MTDSKPLVLRMLNRAGTAARAVGLPLFRLDEQTLFDKAATEAGLSDFGDDYFRHPLAVLLQAFESEAQLTPLGRMIAQRDVVRLLKNRLHMVDAHKRNPDIGRGEIRRPLFIVGLPRTGTTILHELMAQDPANRVPMTWEVQDVWPPPERTTYDSDPRIAATDKHFAGIDQIIPGFKRMHPMGAQLPQECVALTAHDFATMIFTTTHNVPSYQRWLDRADMRPVYRSHRRQLQYLQWRCPAERWVLKSPGHLWALDALLDVYPDACIVQTHRDPLKVVASLTSLVTVLRSMASDHVDAHAVGAEWAPLLAAGLEKTMAVRDRLQLQAERVFDMDFREFLRDEIAMVRRIYGHFGMTLTAEAEGRMRAFLEANPKDKHGAHRYGLGDTGLDVARERERFAKYRQRFAIESEAVD
jgi:hypothetical protein